MNLLFVLRWFFYQYYTHIECPISEDMTTKQCLDISRHFEASLSLAIDSLYSVQLPRQTHPHNRECYHRGSWPGRILRCHNARNCVHTSFLVLCTPLPPPGAKLNLCNFQILFFFLKFECFSQLLRTCWNTTSWLTIYLHWNWIQFYFLYYQEPEANKVWWLETFERADGLVDVSSEKSL